MSLEEGTRRLINAYKLLLFCYMMPGAPPQGSDSKKVVASCKPFDPKNCELSKPRFFVVIALVSSVNLTHPASFEKGVSVEGIVLVRLVGGHLLGIVLGVIGARGTSSLWAAPFPSR